MRRPSSALMKKRWNTNSELTMFSEASWMDDREEARLTGVTPAADEVGIWKKLPAIAAEGQQQYSKSKSHSKSHYRKPSTALQGNDGKDGGRRAWMFMVSACVIEAFLWGFTTSFGIFLADYRSRPEFRDSKLLATVGTCASGIPFLGAPLLTTAVSRWPHYQRQMIWAGTFLCVASLIVASFATRGWHLLLSQGIGYGLGVLIAYYPMLAMVNSWFTEKRGLAYGVLFAAAGISGTGLPFVLQVMLKRFGYGWTLRGYACAIIVLVIPTFPFCFGRPTSTLTPNTPLKPDWAILKDLSLIIFSLANLFQGLAYYIPALYLPSFAEALRLKPAEVVLLIALLNASQVVAQVLLGFISDKTSVFMLVPISTLGAAVWTAGLWFFGRNVATILAFSVLFGLFTGGFTSLWARFNMTLSDDQATQEFAYGLLATQRGLGNVAAGPISMALLRMSARGVMPSPRHIFGNLILFVVICMGVASLGGLGGRFQRKKVLDEVPMVISAPIQNKRASMWGPPNRYSMR